MATRQTFAAACRAATMAPALSPIQSALRSMPGCLPVCDWPKPAGYCNSMDKAERQRLIASVVSRRRVGSQHELAASLADAGCEVTQATISRDIRELRLEKTTDALGRPRYVLPGRARRGDPREVLNGVLRQFGHRATAAQSIVVVQSELGSAPAIGRALDELGHPKIVGTLAGDDTCLVITRSVRAARAVARELSSALS